MTIHEAAGLERSTQIVQPDEMDWDAYARHYDEMCALNPAYHDNIHTLLARLDSWDLPKDLSVCDLGAGTGNYIVQMARARPSAHFWHVDFDERMIELARAKYENEAIKNIHIVHQEVHAVDFPDDSFDLVISINALYAFTPQQDVLSRVRRWLKPHGKLFLIDFGRKQRTLDWTFYMGWESIKANRFGRYTRALLEAREVMKQSRKTTKGQESGRYWLHTTSEFGEALSRAGFRVDELAICYRGYADLAVCSK